MTKLIKFIQTNTKLSDSFALALVYSIGHVLIAMTVVKLMTGASFWESGLVALIEPSINGVWFYVLHKIWRKFSGDPKAVAFDD